MFIPTRDFEWETGIRIKVTGLRTKNLLKSVNISRLTYLLVEFKNRTPGVLTFILFLYFSCLYLPLEHFI